MLLKVWFVGYKISNYYIIVQIVDVMHKFKELRIGKLKLRNNLVLAPMVDVTDLAYREICREAGAGMAYTEMIYIDAILHENEKTKRLMKTSKMDNPIGLQVTGKNEEEFSKFAKLKEIKKFDLIDINCGCPSIKITGNEAGSYLLKTPLKIGKMIKILKKEGFIVTAKIRLGFDKINVLEVAREIEKSGADALSVHARLAIHGRDIPADWKWIAKVKKIVKIPVIGNGDLFSGKDAGKMFLETDCDGIMIARAAIGDPLIFSRVLNYFKTGEEEKSDFMDNFKMFKKYLRLVEKYEIVDLERIKYLGGKFIKGFNGAASLRNELVKLKSLEEIGAFVDKLKIR